MRSGCNGTMQKRKRKCSSPKRLKPDPVVVETAESCSNSSSSISDSDDELPSLNLSFEKNQGSIDVGNVVWAKSPSWPPWPAVVVKVTKKSFHVNYFAYDGETSLCRKKGVRDYNCDERDKLKMIPNCLKKLRNSESHIAAFTSACKQAEQVLSYKLDPDHRLFSSRERLLFKRMTERRKGIASLGGMTVSVPKFSIDEKASDDDNKDDASDEEKEKESKEEVSEGGEEEEEEEDNVNPLYSNVDYVLKILDEIKDELKRVYTCKDYSWRHNFFKSKKREERLSLKGQADHRPLNKETHSKLIQSLLSITSNHRYVFEVLAPEAVIRIIKKTEEIPLKEAEQRYNFYNF
ncbi:uncharacterized protein [Oscarella lobularis]|uniref:uncharacterized protein n=1 Tax=Oscarella lobularis TaxID=121494 RepID=UPI003313592C